MRIVKGQCLVDCLIDARRNKNKFARVYENQEGFCVLCDEVYKR